MSPCGIRSNERSKTIIHQTNDYVSMISNKKRNELSLSRASRRAVERKVSGTIAKRWASNLKI
jgi:phosphoribosylanthranilate isomerase